MFGCKKCSMITALLFLVLGVLLLLRDLGVWDPWNVQWATGLFLILGVTGIAKTKCPDCQALKKSK